MGGIILESLFEKIISLILNGGPQALVAVFVLIIVFLWLERRRLLHELEKKDDKIDRIIDDYSKGNVTLGEALNSLKLVLYEIKGKL
jgi:hypothetical protein